MSKSAWSTHSSECGASAVEYGLLIALIALATVAAIVMFGDEVRQLFEGNCRAVADNAGRRSC